MTADIRILTGSTVPIYQQIVDQARHAIVAGQLPSGGQLPSVRVLAERLVINPNTVARAYQELVRDGVIEAQPGKGYFVTKRRQVYTKAERQRRLDQALQQFVSQVVLLDFSPQQIVEAMEGKLRDIGSAGI